MNLYKFIFIVGTIADVGLVVAVTKNTPRTEESLLVEQYFRKRKGPRKLHLGFECENTKYVMPETYDVGVVKTYPDNVFDILLPEGGHPMGFHRGPNNRPSLTFDRCRKEVYPDLEARRSLEAMRLPRGYFDEVNVTLFENVPTDGKLIQECLALTKPGGRIVLSLHGLYGCFDVFHPCAQLQEECFYHRDTQKYGFWQLGGGGGWPDNHPVDPRQRKPNNPLEMPCVLLRIDYHAQVMNINCCGCSKGRFEDDKRHSVYDGERWKWEDPDKIQREQEAYESKTLPWICYKHEKVAFEILRRHIPFLKAALRVPADLPVQLKFRLTLAADRLKKLRDEVPSRYGTHLDIIILKPKKGYRANVMENVGVDLHAAPRQPSYGMSCKWFDPEGSINAYKPKSGSSFWEALYATPAPNLKSHLSPSLLAQLSEEINMISGTSHWPYRTIVTIGQRLTQ